MNDLHYWRPSNRLVPVNTNAGHLLKPGILPIAPSSCTAIAAASADSEAQRRLTAEAAKRGFPLLYGMDEATMHGLGLYVSEPRSAAETDHRFPEPALFVVNPQGALHLVDVANAPFLRPHLDLLIGGLRFVIEKS